MTTAVLLVDQPISTRTVREFFFKGGWEPLQRFPSWGLLKDEFRRERQVCEPIYVDAPTGPCPECEGKGWLGLLSEAEVDDLCEHCDGTGWVPASPPDEMLLATEQVRHTYKSGPARWHDPDTTCVGEDHFADDERRQVIAHRAATIDVLPVVAFDQSPFPQVFIMHYPADAERDLLWLWQDDDLDQHDSYEDVTDEPWAQGLQPGMTVWRITPEPLAEPITEVGEPCGDEEMHLVPIDIPAGRIVEVEVP